MDSTWQKQWQSWSQALDDLGIPMALMKNGEDGCYWLNDAAKSDLDTERDFVRKEFLDQLKRTVLVKDQALYVWLNEVANSEADLAALSPREKDVHAAMLRGKSLIETSESLGISTRTVEKHRENIRKKLTVIS